MLHEDSNGESSFEIIDKNSAEKQASNSGISGNLLSNVPPPAALPNFISTTSVSSNTTIIPPSSVETQKTVESETTDVKTNDNSLDNYSKVSGGNFYQTEFSAAVPPNKGIQYGTDPNSSRSSSISTASIAEPTKIENPLKKEETGGIFGWVRGAVSSGGILHKVAEKAKHSVDSMITTLDPQMREYIYSGGDLDILVSSIQEDKVSAVREAFQSVFGKATVEGMQSQVKTVAVQPIGFKAGLKGAEEQIENLFKYPKLQPVPIVAVQSFLTKLEDDGWYELAIVLLKDPVRQISLHTYTQMTPIPSEIVTLAEEDTPKDYPLKDTGFSVTIGSFMAGNLGVNRNQWHQTLTGIYRREMILMATKVIANLYRNCTQV